MFMRFVESQTGAVAPIFAIALLPMVAATGAAVDYAQAYQMRTTVQLALDAGALAANRKIGVLTEAGIRQEAENFYLANLGDEIMTAPAFTMTLSGGELTLDTQLKVPTHFLGVIGFKELIFDITSKAVAGAATYEVALVLDNSGSMSGSKISSLKTAAKDLVRILFEVNASNPKTDPVKFALVPFAASVNVGAGYRTASWMDQTGLSPIHHEDFENATKTRWQLYDTLDTDWAGCVMTRPSPYDISDDTPTTATPATLFVPMFAPDEADKGSFNNNYINDQEGNCASSVPNTGTSTTSQQNAQKRLCKYNNEDPDNGKPGPNQNCTTKPIQLLTTSKSTIDTQLTAMQANGLTNIHSGIMWGWRTLSPTVPFTEGRAYDTKDNRKILVIMTDGANTYNSNSTFNKSEYGYFGYVVKNHLGTTSTNNSTVVGKMDDKTLAACEAVKATNKITVYTVAFQINDPDTVQMLEDCATTPEMAFVPDSNADLIASFNQIATDISLLRLAE